MRHDHKRVMSLRGPLWAGAFTAVLATVALLLMGGCGLVDALAGADPPDPAAVAALEDAQEKYAETVKELEALRAQVDTEGVTPAVFERLAAQVSAVAAANNDVQAAVAALRAQEEEGGAPWWLALAQILGAQLGLDWIWRGGPSKGAGGALLKTLAGSGRSTPT